MRQAAAREDARPVAFGPPEVVKPAHELLGELLMQVGRPRDAEVEFQRELSAAPKRARSLLDLGRAAVAAGDTATAATAFATLRSIWHSADADIPGRADITRFFTQHPTE